VSSNAQGERTEARATRARDGVNRAGGEAEQTRGSPSAGTSCLTRRTRWRRRTLAVLPLSDGADSGQAAGDYWGELFRVPDAGQFRIGRGSVDTHTTAERLAAIPGPRVRVDPSSAVSSTTCNPSPRPPLPRRPQRETPSIRAKCRQSASHRTRGHAADLGRFGDPLGIRLLTCGVWLRYIVDWRESDGARSAPRTFDQGPARRGVSLFRGADSGLHAGEQARYSQVIDRYGYTGPGVTSKGSTVCVPLVQ
jgi:hypothetical protein